jgi:hypothetical protein
MHPPFGFALFYLRSVAPEIEYNDSVTGKKIAPVTIGHIYRGAVPFVLIQLVMVAMIISFPGLVSRPDDVAASIDPDAALRQMQDGSQAADAAAENEVDDPMKAMQQSIEADRQNAPN